jgi:hypothetical protein
MWAGFFVDINNALNITYSFAVPSRFSWMGSVWRTGRKYSLRCRQMAA